MLTTAVHRGTRTRRLAARAIAGIGTLLAACGSGKDLSKQLDTLSSWTATAQLAVAEHRAGAISTTYATQLGDDARQALEEARQALPRAEHDASDQRRAGAALDSLERAIKSLDAESR